MSQADDLINKADFTIDELIEMVENKLTEAKWRNSITGEGAALAMDYLILKTIRKELNK